MLRMVSLAIVVVAVSLAMIGCGQTVSPVVQSSTASATETSSKAGGSPAEAAAQSPKSKGVSVAYPEKGKSVTFIVSHPAGGAADVSARLLAPFLEKRLGIPVQVVNKPGAAGQIGVTELARAKPDGYTIGYTNLPAVIMSYLDPDRDVTFTRKDLMPLAMHIDDPGAIIVKGDSPFMTMKDLLDAAKSNPERVRDGTSGVLGSDHVFGLLLEQASGGKFSFVHFEGSAPAMVALLGGHVDVVVGTLGVVGSAWKSGKARMLGIADKEESKLYPGVATLEAQGHKMHFSASRVVSAPAGVSKGVADILSAALRDAIQDPEHLRKVEEAGMMVRYMDPGQVDALWAETEAAVKPVIPLARR